MSIMAKTPSGYKKIGSAYLGERPVDKVFNANGDVIYALQRELTGVPPLLFKGKEQSDLLNYRIYGDTVDGNSVGDLVESGEHAGEYEVPVTVEGKNLLLNTARSQTVNGVRFTLNSDGSVTCNGQASSLSVYKIPIYLYASTLYILNGCPFGGSSEGYSADLRYSDVMVSSRDIGTGINYNCTQTGTYAYGIRIVQGYTCDNLTFYPMIRKADIEDDTYEPYHAPVTVPIYIPEPIKMVGDEAEYIDYAEQKMHRVRKNLFDVSTTTPNCYVDDEGRIIGIDGIDTSDFIKVSPNTNYTYKGVVIYNSNTIRIAYYDQSKNFISRHFIIGNAVDGETVTTPSNCEYVKLSYDKVITNLMLNSGSTSLPYEPYIENVDLDVTLPALPTLPGTNVLSVDTEVQPSRMDIKGRIKSLT